MAYPQYEIWIADLSSLYELEIRPAVFAEDCFSYTEAKQAIKEYQSHDTAAWIQDKDTGQVVT